MVIGNVTKDVTPEGPLLGGTSSYAAIAAYRLGARVAVVSAIGDDAPPLTALDGIAIHTVSAASTVTFQNIYRHGARHQRLLAEGGHLSLKDVPAAWRNTPIIHLAPIAQEFSPALCAKFPNNLVGATVQGWLRGKDSDNNVIYRRHPDFWKYISHIDVLIMSLSDFFGDKNVMIKAAHAVPLAVETLGADGCAIYRHGQRTHVPVATQPEADPTGAGDIFAAAFLLEFARSQDALRAAQFANACASLSVMEVGVSGAPTRARAEAHFRQSYHHRHY